MLCGVLYIYLSVLIRVLKALAIVTSEHLRTYQYLWSVTF